MKRLLSCLIICAATLSAAAQMKWSPTYQSYINQYKDLAIEQMMKYKIPASITLAQGLFESRAGQSELAVRGNNHFGIKCHGWRGRKMYHDDDEAGECFRVYDNPYMSFEDHSKFLATQQRYSRLFALSKTDYKGWAKGLQKCGYATDRAYANKLIKVIEDYELYRYDRMKVVKKTTKRTTTSNQQPTQSAYQVYRTHGLIYVYAQENDSFDHIAANLGFSPRKLRKYNEVPEDFPLEKGDIIYLEKKKKKADKPYSQHVVQVGESMHDIAQKYGIQIKSLYKMNKKSADYIPMEGDVLKLR